MIIANELKFDCMKYIFRSLAVLILLIAVSPHGMCANKTEIRLLLKKGQKFEYVVTGLLRAEKELGDKPTVIEQKMELTIDQVVLDKLRNGNYLIQADYKRFMLELNSGEKIQNYDSNLSNNQPWFDKLLGGLTKLSLKYEVSPFGVVSNLKGFEEIMKNKYQHEEIVNFIKEFGTDRIISQLYNYIPKMKVEPEDQWKRIGTLPEMNNQLYDINFTLTEITAENCKIDLQATFKYNSDKKIIQNGKSLRVEVKGVQKGNIIVDSKNNMPLLSTINQGTEMLVYSKDTITNFEEVSQMKMSFKTTTKLVK